MNEDRPPADPSAGSDAEPTEASGGVLQVAPDATPDADADAAEPLGEDPGEEPGHDPDEALEPVAEAAAMGGPDEVDTAFSDDLDPETLAFGAPKPQAVVCQWCNGPLDTTDLETCPHCGSRLKPTEEDLVVPGVTTLSADAARALELAAIQRNRDAAKSGQAMYATPSLAGAAAIVPAPDEATVEAANRPPDEDVRRMMQQMELEARQARAAASARADSGAMSVAEVEHDGSLEQASSDAELAASAAPEHDDSREAGDTTEPDPELLTPS